MLEHLSKACPLDLGAPLRPLAFRRFPNAHLTWLNSDVPCNEPILRVPQSPIFYAATSRAIPHRMRTQTRMNPANCAVVLGGRRKANCQRD